MTLLAETLTTTEASRAANAAFAANCAALRDTQSVLVDNATDEFAFEGEFVFGRDGALTAREADQSWFAGCSIPRRSAESMLRNFKPTGPVAMLLAPFHASAIRTVLEKLDRAQAVIAVFPSRRDFLMAMHCDDFSKDIASHRLWFIAGENLADQLDAVMQQQPGLPTPSYFIRLGATERQANDLIPELQPRIAPESRRRDVALAEMRQPRKRAKTLSEKSEHPNSRHSTSAVRVEGIDDPRSPAVVDRGLFEQLDSAKCPAEIRSVCVVAPTEFRLWADSGHVLQNVLANDTSAEFVPFNPDDPAASSPLALAGAVANCDAIVTANLGRANFPNVVADDVPWITWVTQGQIPATVATSPADGVVLADAAWKPIAIAAGWTEAQIAIGHWPSTAIPQRSFQNEENVPQAGPLNLGNGGCEKNSKTSAATAIIADTCMIKEPETWSYSSHGLLWTAVAEDLAANPFALSESIDKYLRRRMEHLSIREEGFNRNRFIDELIVPAYQQGIARMLVKHRIPLQLFGRGWNEIDDLKPYAAGAVDTREQWQSAVSRASVLIHAWPIDSAHPIDASGRMIVRSFGKNRDLFIRDVQNASAGKTSPAGSLNPISAQTVLRLLRRGE